MFGVDVNRVSHDGILRNLRNAEPTPTPSSAAFLYKDQMKPKPSPLAIVRERLFLNSESEDLWLSATCAVSFNGGRRSRTPIPRRGLSFPFD